MPGKAFGAHQMSGAFAMQAPCTGPALWLAEKTEQAWQSVSPDLQMLSRAPHRALQLEECRPLPKPGCWEIGFRQISLKKCYTINEIHKQYSLLDTILNYIFYLGPPGKYLYLSPQDPLHVGRWSRPTCSRFSWLFYRYFPGGPK